ncbi:MAG: GntR family transcriptional regulator [Sneathiellaceae bacterium]
MTIESLGEKPGHTRQQGAPAAVPEPEGLGLDPAFSRSQLVINHIVAGLRDGRYGPGQTLVAAELMKELGLSKAPVREALHLLVGEGMIELLPNRSVRLTRLDSHDVRGFLDVWSSLGGTSLRLAAHAIGRGADGRVLAARIGGVSAAAGRGITYEFLMSIADYHRAAAELGGNRFVQRFIGLAHFEHTYRHLVTLMPVLPFREYADRFAGVHEAVTAGDGKRAERLFRAHMDWVAGLLRSA